MDPGISVVSKMLIFRLTGVLLDPCFVPVAAASLEGGDREWWRSGVTFDLMVGEERVPLVEPCDDEAAGEVRGIPVTAGTRWTTAPVIAAEAGEVLLLPLLLVHEAGVLVEERVQGFLLLMPLLLPLPPPAAAAAAPLDSVHDPDRKSRLCATSCSSAAAVTVPPPSPPLPCVVFVGDATLLLMLDAAPLTLVQLLLLFTRTLVLLTLAQL